MIDDELIATARHEVATLPEPWSGLARFNLAIFSASKAGESKDIVVLSRARDNYRKQHGIISTSQYRERQGP